MPRPLRPVLAAALLVLLAPAAAPAALDTPTPVPAHQRDAHGDGQLVLEHINTLRAAGAVCGTTRHPPAGPLTWNEPLAGAAHRHALDMATRDHHDHTGSDGSTATVRAREAGFQGPVGENIAAGQRTIERALEGLMGSEGHCENIMRPIFTEFGGALELNRWGRTHWVQLFG